MAAEQIGDATLYLGDCLTEMERIPDGSVDMVLCDLPYGTTANKWDSVVPLEPLWAQYRRIAKPNAAIVLTAQTPFDKVLGCSNLSWLRYEWAWDKGRGTTFLQAAVMPLRQHENVLIFYRRKPTYNPQMTVAPPYQDKRTAPGVSTDTYRATPLHDTTRIYEGRYPTTVLRFARDYPKVHPTQKPAALFAYLIRTYTNPGDLVLDNCAGSGTTGVACQQEGRRCILIERDPAYYQTMRARLSAPRQTRLAEGA